MSKRFLAVALCTMFSVAGSGCISKTSFECTIDEQCSSSGIVGRCETEGLCSFPDEECSDGFRFGESSGERAGQCVGNRDGGVDDPLCLDIAELELGGTHSCLRTVRGEVHCWGSNATGQLGNDTLESESKPVLVPALPDVTQISAGGSHTCGLGEDGYAWCWGSNGTGQLGDNDSGQNRLLPAPVTRLDDAIAISAGSAHTCALRRNGTAACWGNNSAGQLGTGDKLQANSPSTVVAAGDETFETILENVSAIASGGNHSCAIVGGAVQCWGNGSSGQLGDDQMAESLVPVPVVGISGSAASLALGNNHSCVLTAEGAVYCWGRNSEGQVGDGTLDPTAATARKIVSTVVLTSLSAGDNHTCAHSAEGASLCWGANDTAQVGQGTLVDLVAPVEVMTDSRLVAAGGGHSCGVDSSGSMLCWGSDRRGQLGRAALLSSTQPIQVATPTGTADAIAAAGSHACAIKDGAVHCWGANDQGQLGDGTTVATAAPIPPLADSSPLVAASRLSVSSSGSCAVLDDGTAQCWGSQSLGFNSLVPQPISATVPTPIVAVSLSPSRVHYLTSVQGEELWCSGFNSNGECGKLNYVTSTSAISLSDLVANVTQVHSGGSHTCVLADATISCFGSNGGGRLGNAVSATTAGGPAIPVTLPFPPVELFGGSNHTCARLSDGSISCWGYNNNGELGDGTTIHTNTKGGPVQAALPTNDVKSGFGHGSSTCVILGDDTLWCWGYNAQDVYNTGSIETKTLQPTQVLSDPIKQAAMGNGFLCVILKADDSLKCWGTNLDGQIGDGREVLSLRPSETVSVCAGPS